ncbi:HP0729 family protein [Helicobacter sp. 23-1048]
MTNLLILYNPYYQDTVIESHLEVLKQKGKVAFGKVRSKLKDTLGSQKSQSENPLDLATIKSELHSQKAQDKRAYLQLFLTDYANLYVAKVDEILDKSQAPNEIIPNYYQQKGLNVEEYFIITDLREIVRDDFATLRDKYLANFTTPAFANHTYALYGNAYTYPIEVVQKREVCYFEGDERHFLTLFKSEAFLAQKQILTDYIFGDYLYALHPDSFENLIFAEMEFHANKNDKLYDFSGVILRYAKAFESECYEFVRQIVRILGAKDSAILELKFGVGSKMKEVANLSHEKAMLGAYLHLLDNLLRKSIKAHLSAEIVAFCARFTKDIAFMQKARNPVAHSDFARFEMANAVRDKIIGVGQSSVMVEILKAKELLK